MLRALALALWLLSLSAGVAAALQAADAMNQVAELVGAQLRSGFGQT